MQLPDFLFESSPGEITIVGHRIGLYSIARRHKDGMSAERIAEEFPTLTLEQVQNVIAFSEENREEVDRYVEAYDREMDRLEALYSRPEFWAELRERYARMFPGRRPTPLKD